MSGIDAWRRSSQRERCGQLGRQVLERMNSKVYAPVGQRFLDFLGEHALGAHLGKGDVLQAITGCLDDLDFDDVSFAAKKHSDEVRLPECQLRATATYRSEEHTSELQSLR